MRTVLLRMQGRLASSCGCSDGPSSLDRCRSQRKRHFGRSTTRPARGFVPGRRGRSRNGHLDDRRHFTRGGGFGRISHARLSPCRGTRGGWQLLGVGRDFRWASRGNGRRCRIFSRTLGRRRGVFGFACVLCRERRFIVCRVLRVRRRERRGSRIRRRSGRDCDGISETGRSSGAAGRMHRFGARGC